MNSEIYTPLSCAGLTHHNAEISGLEDFRFPDEAAFLLEARQHFKGVVLLQTCNRVEILVEGESDALAAFLKENGREGFWTLEGEIALRHLLRLASGMESMIIGEDQIIGQLKKALSTAQETGTCSPLLELCITKSVHVGIEVRKQTHINNGAVSIGSAAVQMAEELLGSLGGKHILVVGGGEMGKLVTQALAAKGLTAIYVTNRTYERALELADEVGGRAFRLNELSRYMPLADVVISCTAAPHPVIRYDAVSAMLKERQWPLDEQPHPLILIDIAQPRDIEESVGSIEGVHLFTIDDLRSVSETNMHHRREAAKAASEIIRGEMAQFIRLVNRTATNDKLSHLYSWAEVIRTRERDRALSRLGETDQRTAEIVDDLSKVLVKKLLMDATLSVRTSAECGDLTGAEIIVRAITEGEPVCIHKEDSED